MSAGFKAGTGNVLQLPNRPPEVKIIPEAGGQPGGDQVSYPDDSLMAVHFTTVTACNGLEATTPGYLHQCPTRIDSRSPNQKPGIAGLIDRNKYPLFLELHHSIHTIHPDRILRGEFAFQDQLGERVLQL